MKKDGMEGGMEFGRNDGMWAGGNAKMRTCAGRRRGGRMRTAALAAALALLLTACGAPGEGMGISSSPMKNGTASYEPSAAYDSAQMEYGYDNLAAESVAEAAADYDSASGAVGNVQQVDNSAYYDERKLIRTVNLDVETKEFDQMLQSIEEQVERLGGYIESMNTYNGSRYARYESGRSSSLTVRIPKQQLSGFVNAVSEAGNVVSRSENVQDVTLSYVDLESRKKALMTEQERLQAILERAETLEDIITLEDRLSSVRYQLESMEAQLRTYDNKVDFSTVNLSIQEVKELTPVEEETVWERLTGGFTDSLTDVKDGLVDFFVWFVASIPYLVLWGAVIAAVVLVIRMIIRRNRRKKAAKLQNMQRMAAAANPAQNTPDAHGERNQQSQSEKK
ncbi:MAG: DUF4349 domain-containing protein [Muribaculum sp.]|nr:DUF4349 domain-containing protein [Muribaculum sp.]